MRRYRSHIYTALIALIVGLVIGFFVGRGKTIIKEYHTIEWKASDPVVVNVPYPYPVKEQHTTINEKLVPGEVVRDTVFIVDTAGVVDDYMVERTYSQTYFDSKEQGRLTVNSIVQYNKQKSLGIDYTPVTRIETIKQLIEPTWTPFLSGGLNTNNYISLGGGIFYHDIGFEYNYNQNINLNSSFHEFKLKYKF